MHGSPSEGEIDFTGGLRVGADRNREGSGVGVKGDRVRRDDWNWGRVTGE